MSTSKMSILTVTRRSFLKGLLWTVGGAASPILFETIREPYINEGDLASYIGARGAGFVGAQAVREVGAWDGVGYPVTTLANTIGRPTETEVFYDFDLSDFNREVPYRFWADPHNSARYNNVHTYVRELRGISDKGMVGSPLCDDEVRMMFA